MQNMFATMNIQQVQQQQQGQGQVKQGQQQSGLDLLNSTGQTNNNDFNTMQNLFATGMPGQVQGGNIQNLQGINLGTQQTSNPSFPSPT